jgi:hypothetical protein
VPRIVEQVSFLPGGGQQWERQIQLCLPTLPDIPAHKRRHQSRSAFIVSLGTFRRRRFADFTVTNDDGTQCRLLTRRQHGFCLATCFMLQLLNSQEWEGNLDSTALRNLHSYLVSMITTMPPSKSHSPQDAQVLLDNLLYVSKINNEDHTRAAREILRTHCESIAAQTQYLCWVTSMPGRTVNLRVTYTQADSPSPRYEPESEADAVTDFTPRVWWRNVRTREYAKYNLFPFRYSFDAPSYSDCQSYYFSISPPPDTRITLLDWGNGRRFQTAVEDAGWDSKKHFSQEQPMPPDGMADEVDCARFGYHFHNRRVAKRRRVDSMDRRQSGSRRWPIPGDQRQSADRRWPRPDRRQRDVGRATRIHVFLRPEPIDNAKLAAIGFLGLVLAFMAERGVLFGGGSISQWLLVAPAALVVLISQQRRHYYARFTKRYRLSIWVYTAIAIFFAGSVAFDAPSIPFLSNGETLVVARSISAIFAFASGWLIVASMWSGKHFEKTTRKRYRRIVTRVNKIGDPAYYKWLKYRWSEIGNKLEGPIDVPEEQMRKHPSDKVYTSTARHSIDRVLALTAVLTMLIASIMILHWFNWHWGVAEECAIDKTHARQVTTEGGRQPHIPSKCLVDHMQSKSAKTGHGAKPSPQRPNHTAAVPSLREQL